MIAGVGVSTAGVGLASISIFNPTTIFGWAGIIFMLAGILYGARAYGKQKAGEVWQHTAAGWKEEATANKEKAERLEVERDEQRALKHEALNEVATLKLKTDLTEVQRALVSIIETQGKQTLVLDAMAARLLQPA